MTFIPLPKGTDTMPGSVPVTVATDDTVLKDVPNTIATHDAAVKSMGPQTVVAARSALPAAVAEGDAVRAIADLYGRLMLAGYDLTADALRESEVNPLSEQYVPITLIDDQAVIAAAVGSAPAAAGQAVAPYKDAVLQVYLLGGLDAVPADRTVTITVKGTLGLLVGAATEWVDITRRMVNLETGVDDVASFSSTGNTATSLLLSFGSGNLNLTHFRVDYEWDGAPVVGTPGKIVILVRFRAL